MFARDFGYARLYFLTNDNIGKTMAADGGIGEAETPPRAMEDLRVDSSAHWACLVGSDLTLLLPKVPMIGTWLLKFFLYFSRSSKIWVFLAVLFPGLGFFLFVSPFVSFPPAGSKILWGTSLSLLPIFRNSLEWSSPAF